MKIDALMRQAAMDREIRAERTINWLRGSAVAVIAVIDTIILVVIGQVDPVDLTWLGLGTLVFAGYLFAIHHWTRGDQYRAWLKYITIAGDYGMTCAIFFFFKHMGFTMGVAGASIPAHFVTWLVLINGMSAFRCGNAVILYSTLLGIAVASLLILGGGAPWITLVYASLMLVASGVLVWVISYGTGKLFLGLRRKEQLMRFLSRDLVESVEAGEVDLDLGGDKCEVTILLSDIRGFTTLSESRDPLEVVSLLNEFFTEMSLVIHKNGGVIDKYIGDAILAVFGAPVARPDAPRHAVRAALGMRAALTALNARLEARGQQPIKTGIALHTGDVVAGNIGSTERMEYTVIGDTVNVTARIESLNKQYQTWLLMSEQVRDQIGDDVQTRLIGETKVKGRNQPVRVYTLEEPLSEEDKS